MQANSEGDHQLVKICMAAICRNEGFTDPDQMVQRDLQFLCDRIHEKTGVLLSLSTVKRLLNGQFSRLPQIATLDAIAVTAGYKNWQSLKLTHSQNSPANGVALPVIAGKTNKHRFPRFLLWGGLVLIALIVAVFLINAGRSGVRNAGSAHFSALKVTGNDVPNTVVFKYNIDSVQADSFFIQQSWDINRRVRIFKHHYTLTDIYYEPGYHTAKLIANNKIIKKLAVSISTDKWFFYTKENVRKSIPKYLQPADDGVSNGSMQLSPADLVAGKVNAEKENIILQVYFPSKIASSSDNFVLKFRVKVNPLNNEACPYLMSEVFCQRYFMYFRSTLKGCTSIAAAQFGENALDGKTTDFSSLGLNVKDWQNVEFAVKDKKATISINNSKVFTAAYHQSCGLITGIGFISNGLCQVDFVDLKTADGKVIYGNDFNE